MAGEFTDDLGGGAAEPLTADLVLLMDRISQEIAEQLQIRLVGADGGERQVQDGALMGEELIGITDGLVPRNKPGVIDKAADQSLMSQDRTGHEFPGRAADVSTPVSSGSLISRLSAGSTKRPMSLHIVPSVTQVLNVQL